MNILTTPHMERCIGCYSCSLACARRLAEIARRPVAMNAEGSS